MSDSKDFIWTDELVAEYSLASQPLSIFEFKRQKQQPSKDWEIVSFRHIYTKENIWSVGDDGNYCIYKSGALRYSLDRMLNDNVASLKSGDIEIYEVRRISDGEVFKVGDVINYKGMLVRSWEGNNGCNITKFSIHEGYIYINGHFPFHKDKKISDWEKVKPKLPLFTTSDGVKKYLMDSYWSVSDEFYLCYSNAHPDFKPLHKRTFSSKEAAEQYILENKPISVSYKELNMAIDLATNDRDYSTANRMICKMRDFFKSKINP